MVALRFTNVALYHFCKKMQQLALKNYHSRTLIIPISRIKNILLNTIRVPIVAYIKSCPFRLIPKAVGTIEWG